MSISDARARQRGSVLIIALATLLIIAALGAGVLSAVTGSAENRAERLHAERAFHAVESGIRRANAGAEFPEGDAFAVGSSWFRAEDGFCPPERSGFAGWSGAEPLDDAMAVHALCAELAEGGDGNAGAGEDPDHTIASLFVSLRLPGRSTLANTLISSSTWVWLRTSGGQGLSRTIRNVTIDAGLSASISLGNNPTIDNLFITSNSSVTIDFGGGGSSVSCLLIQAGGPVYFPGRTPQQGVEYFTDPAAWEAAGCGSFTGGGGSGNWEYAG